MVKGNVDCGGNETYQLWEDFVIDDFLGKVINHQGEVIKQTDPYCSVGVGEQAYNDRCDLGVVLLLGKFCPYLHDSVEDFGAAATKLYRFEQFGEYFHFEEIRREVVGYFIQFTDDCQHKRPLDRLFIHTQGVHLSLHQL